MTARHCRRSRRWCFPFERPFNPHRRGSCARIGNGGGTASIEANTEAYWMVCRKNRFATGVPREIRAGSLHQRLVRPYRSKHVEYQHASWHGGLDSIGQRHQTGAALLELLRLWTGMGFDPTIGQNWTPIIKIRSRSTICCGNGELIATAEVNVPEPVSVAVFGAGLLGLGAASRRRL